MAMTITKDEALKLLGLFTLATQHYALVRDAEAALCRAIGLEPNETHISETIFGREDFSAGAFYRALALDGVTIADENPDQEEPQQRD